MLMVFCLGEVCSLAQANAVQIQSGNVLLRSINQIIKREIALGHVDENDFVDLSDGAIDELVNILTNTASCLYNLGMLTDVFWNQLIGCFDNVLSLCVYRLVVMLSRQKTSVTLAICRKLDPEFDECCASGVY
jgi:predicted house-cleaning NTP pyrophosphatase (Maf/HAM1 superfamily)